MNNICRIAFRNTLINNLGNYNGHHQFKKSFNKLKEKTENALPFIRLKIFFPEHFPSPSCQIISFLVLYYKYMLDINIIRRRYAYGY